MAAPMNGSPPASSASGAGGITPVELAAMLRKSADVVERKEFHPLLFHTMRALTAYAGEYADGGVSSKSSVAGGTAPQQPSTAAALSGAASSAAAGQQQKLRRRDAAGSEQQQQAHKDRDLPGKKKSAFHDVPDTVLDSKGAAATSGGAAAAAERVGASGGQFSSAAAAAGSKQDNTSQKLSHKGVFSLKGIKKGIERIGADVNKFVGDHDKNKDDVPFDELAWCDEHFTRGCSCKSRKNGANDSSSEQRSSVVNSGSTESINKLPQQQTSATNNSPSTDAVNDPDKPAKPCFQRPINPSSNLIANGWIDQQRRSKMRVVWKDVLASLVEGRRPGEETTLWIQRQVINTLTGKVTGLEALHQIPMKWLEDVNYVDLYGDHRFTLKVYNIAEEFYFRTRDEPSAQSWVLTLRSARDASLESNVRMAGAPSSLSGSVVSEKKPSAKDLGLHDLDDWDSAKQQAQEGTSAASGSPPLAQASGDGGGDRRPSSSSAATQSQQPAPVTSVRMKISELRAIAHGAGYTTRGMERQDLERIAAHVGNGAFNQNPTPAGTPAAGAGKQQEAAIREAEQRAAAEKREMEQAKAQEESRRQKENEERAVVDKMRREREEAEKRRVEEQMSAAEQQRRHQEFEAQAAGIKRKQEEDRQRKMAELAAAEQARQQHQAAAAAERKSREEEEQRRRQQQQQQQQQKTQQQQARPRIPTPPTSGGYPQGNFPPQQQQQWGQPQQQQQQHYQQWQQQQQQHAHFQQQQGFPGQHQQQPHQQHQQFFNQNMPPQGAPGGAYQQQQQQQQQQRAHYQQQQQQQQQQQKPSQPPPGQNAQGTPALNSKYAKQMEEKTEEEDQSTCTLQIKRSILINWALQPPNLNVLRPIDQLISSIHTAMPPAFGVASHAYFSKFTPIAQTEMIVSAAMGGHPDETKLKKAVRKVRVFLHPDKLPRDLTSDQQFTARMLWDITSDSWEEFQKHKDELDWIRS